MIRVARVEPGSIAEDLAIPAGLAILRINGRELRDGLDLLFYQADERLEIDAETPAGERLLYDIEKRPDESLGVIPEPDKIRRCTNACPFCFVNGNPKAEKLRSTLYVKDDDYRLSFLYGHYVTLTNLRQADWERIFEQRLSPLYVSVHATDPEVRRAMLKNPRSAEIGTHLDWLSDGGIAVHTQVVLCPEVNDGVILERTIEELYARGPSILSLSIVPVGLTAHHADRGIRPLTAEECRAALQCIERARARARAEREFAWCYAADEMFLQAGLEPPGRDYFDEADLESNGVGAISWLRDRVRAGLGELPRLAGHRIVLVTGTSMGPSLATLARELGEACGAEIATSAVTNTLYGPLVTTAGLLAGADHRTALEPYAHYDLALFSRHALDDRERFLDDLSLAELRDAFPRLEIEPSDSIVDVLGRRA
ncbi:MAG: DUF512 domain-containing protein [Gemmatimonadota bacterium]